MNMLNLQAGRSLDCLSQAAEEMLQLIQRLYPICRSITGNGVRETLKILREYIPLTVHEVPSGTPVFDWTIPKEWNIRDAYIKNSNGEKVVDFQKCNLHVLNYSLPIKKKVSLDELKDHMFTIPEHPDWIPYRTSYYKENWGFCLSHTQLSALPDGEYEVFIDASLKNGHLSYGEYLLKGETDDEVLISTHVCHPSLANDNLSGIALAVFLARHLSQLSRRYSYRFLFTPGTIGSITWLSLNEAQTARIKHGLVLACVGDSGKITYKKSRRGNAEIDRAVPQVLKDTGDSYEVFDFSPYGYDERQFCSPGFNLPVGCFMRTPHGKFPEYHTSADDLNFVRPESLADSFAKCWAILDVLERNKTYFNLSPKCEPQLGRRGLYSQIGGQKDGKLQELAMLWVLNLSDGKNSLLDVAERSNLVFAVIHNAAQTLLEHGLLQKSPETTRTEDFGA
jgi:aminopeptidase-like protein